VEPVEHRPGVTGCAAERHETGDWIDGNAAAGKLYVDDLRLYRTAPAAAAEELWMEAESGTITAPMMVFSAIPGASGGQYIEGRPARTVPATRLLQAASPAIPWPSKRSL